MENTEKLKYFEYFVHKTYEWYGKDNQNDLSILKLMKLLFFTTAVNAKKDSENLLLDRVFNNFVAMPFGHVESFIYESIKSNKILEFYELSYSKTIRKDNFAPYLFKSYVDGLNNSITEYIDKSIDELKRKNPDLINYSAFDLVELSHQWFSWKSFYNMGAISGLKSTEIDKEIIISEPKHFFLNQFDLF